MHKACQIKLWFCAPSESDQTHHLVYRFSDYPICAKPPIVLWISGKIPTTGSIK